MPAEILKRNTFFATCFYLATLLALWLPQALLTTGAPAWDDAHAVAPSSEWISGLLQPALSTWTAFALTFITALLLSFLNYRHLFYPSDGYLLPLLYILTAAAIPSTQWFSGAHAAATGVIFGLNALFCSYQKTPGLSDLFTAAFCFSLSAICFPPGLLLLMLLPAAAFFLRPAAWRDWVVMLIGAALPFAYFLLFSWLSLHDIAAATENIAALLPDFPVTIPDIDPPVLILWSVLTGIILLALVHGIPKQSGTWTKTIYIRIIFTWMFILLAAGFVLYPAYGYHLMPLCALPVAAIATGYFARPRNKRLQRLCWLLWLAAIVYVQWHILH
ncbi:MAG: hypothetical protein LBD91_06020 [Prevotellaceae bacterium]|jgi:hypothetical protein|nr:hypothetical protein [Prevotellaceae bacterium]